ncbi:MAG: hypothetical protein HEQ38_02870 [Gemmatimonas sp.]|nr:hypothetical protein [Gemmatimonas sp.]
MVGHAARRAAAGISLLLGVAAAASAGAQSPAAPASATVTRADLAWRYLLMDASYATADSEGRLSDSTRAAINRIFDRSTLSFFGGRFAMTAAMMDTAITMAAPTYRYERRTLPAGVRIDKRPAREVRNALIARLAALDSTGTLAQPIASARARAALLVDTVSAERSAEFLTDPAALARAVTGRSCCTREGT